MFRNRNKQIAFILFLMLIIFVNSSLVYADITTDGGTGSSDIALTQAATQFSVSVPMVLPISVDSQGNITTATNLKILNNSIGPVQVTDISVTPAGGWSLTSYGKDYRKTKIGLKEFGLAIRNDQSKSDGTISLSTGNWGSINGNSSLDVPYLATVPAQKTAVNTTVAFIVFTLDWVEAPIQYLMAADSDFTNVSNQYVYNGSAEYVQVPAAINGSTVTSANNMFENNTALKGVKLPDTITSMNYTFKGCTSLVQPPDIPSNVTSMYAAFQGCTDLKQAPVLPSGVNDLGCCFNQCYSLTQAPVIPDSVQSMNSTFSMDSNLGTVLITIPSDCSGLWGTFQGCPKLSGTITINSSLIMNYEGCFNGASTDSGASLVVKGSSTIINGMTGDVLPLDDIIATKADSSNIVKG